MNDVLHEAAVRRYARRDVWTATAVRAPGGTRRAFAVIDAGWRGGAAAEGAGPTRWSALAQVFRLAALARVERWYAPTFVRRAIDLHFAAPLTQLRWTTALHASPADVRPIRAAGAGAGAVRRGERAGPRPPLALRRAIARTRAHGAERASLNRAFPPRAAARSRPAIERMLRLATVVRELAASVARGPRAFLSVDAGPRFRSAAPTVAGSASSASNARPAPAGAARGIGVLLVQGAAGIGAVEHVGAPVAGAAPAVSAAGRVMRRDAAPRGARMRDAARLPIRRAIVAISRDVAVVAQAARSPRLLGRTAARAERAPGARVRDVRFGRRAAVPAAVAARAAGAHAAPAALVLKRSEAAARVENRGAAPAPAAKEQDAQLESRVMRLVESNLEQWRRTALNPKRVARAVYGNMERRLSRERERLGS